MTKIKITSIFLFLILIITCSQSSDIDEGYIDIGETSLYYKIIGSGEPLLVLHGGPGFDHQILMPYIGKLGLYHKVIQYDQRGSGLSKGPVDSTSINIHNFVEDIEIIRKRFNIDKLNLAGVSWGGILAMFYSIKYPENLNSLILFSTAASSELLYKMYPAMNKNRTPEDDELIKSISKSEGFQRKDPEILEKFYRTFCKAQFVDQSLASKINMTISENTAKNMDSINKYIMSSIGRFNLHESLKVINCPTLIMHGKKDPLPLEAAEKIHSMIPNSELIIFNNSGHWIFIEEEDKFYKTVNEFLAKVTS